MTDLIIELKDAQKTKDLGGAFAKFFKNTPGTILLKGQLGAGKTTFAQSFINEKLDAQVYAGSPTYSIMNSYASDPVIYHFDLYRIKDSSALYNLGLMEFLLDSQALKLVEWPEHAQIDFTDTLAHIELIAVNNTRKANIIYKDTAPIFHSKLAFFKKT